MKFTDIKLPKRLKIAGLIMLGILGPVIITLQILILWLNGNGGAQYVQKRINQSLIDSGIQVKISKFQTHGPFGVGIEQIELLDQSGQFALAQNLGLGFGLSSIIGNHIALDLSAGHIDIYRLPTMSSSGGGAFVFPDTHDLGLNTASVDLQVKRLTLSPQLIEGGGTFVFKLKNDLTIDQASYHLITSLTISEAHGLAAPPPGMIKAQLSATAGSSVLRLDAINIIDTLYQGDISGKIDLAANTLDLDAGLLFPQADKLAADLSGNIKIISKIQGTMASPSARVSGKARFRNKPLNITSDVNLNEAGLSLPNLQIGLAGAKLTGMVQQAEDGWQASLTAQAPNLSLISDIVPGLLPLEGSATALLHLQPDASMTLEVTAQDVIYDTLHATELQLNTSWTNIASLDDVTINGQIKNGHLASTQINDASFNIKRVDNGYDYDLKVDGYDRTPIDITAKGILFPDTRSLDLAEATITTAKGRGIISGNLTPIEANFSAAFSNLDIRELPFIAAPPLPATVTKATLSLTGPLQKPRLKIDLELASQAQNMSSRQSPPPSQPSPPSQPHLSQSISINALVTHNKASIGFIGTSKGLENFAGNLNVPITFSLAPAAFKIQNLGKISGQINADIALKDILTGVLPSQTNVNGTLVSNVTISGTPARPSLNGAVSLSNASYYDAKSNLSLKNITGTIDLSDHYATLSRFNGTDGHKGSFSATGKIDLLKPEDLQANLTLSAMHLMKSQSFDAILNAALQASRTDEGIKISGTIEPEEIQVRIPEQFNKQIPQLNILLEKDLDGGSIGEASILSRVLLDIALRAKNRIFVRGRGLDAELKGDLKLLGTIEYPQFYGNLNVLRGIYDEFGRRFVLEKADLRFNGSIPPSPYLSVDAVTKIDQLKAILSISGPATKPSFSLKSDPAKSEDEIMSHILFGENIKNISPFQAIQLARSLRKLTSGSGGGFDPLNEVRELTGLDEIRVEGVGSEDIRVGAGKYLDDNIFFQVEQSRQDGPSVKLQYEITDEIKLESQAKPTGTAGAGIVWEWDY